MNSKDQIRPGDLIGVHVAIPTLSVYFPDGNHAGTIILERLLNLSLGGVAVGEGVAFGTLNDFTFVILVKSRQQAFPIIRQAFEAIDLMRFAQIAWLCGYELAWRTAYPNPEPSSFDVFIAAERRNEYLAQLNNLRASLALLARP